MSLAVSQSSPPSSETDSHKMCHVDLVLRQIDSLPTLPAVATRLLSLTVSDESSIHEVVELISSDQALTAKVLGMCHRADIPIRKQVLTVERAVALLGFKAIRNAVLSIKVWDLFSDTAEDAQPFDRIGLWRHSLAVAIASELIASAHPDAADLNPEEVFVCGLLHDIGKLALDFVLPKCYQQVIELTELNQGNIAEFERRIIGIDHHAAGKRLAEHWQLPAPLQDCIWLHGCSLNTLSNLEHQRMIGLTRLADLVVRQHHIGYSGNFTFKEDPTELTDKLRLNGTQVDSITNQLHDELHRRSNLLGLDKVPSSQMFLMSIKQANEALGRLNSALERRSRAATRQSQLLEAIAWFHASAAPGPSVQEAIDQVVASAVSVLGAELFAVFYQPDSTGDLRDAPRSWLVCQYNQQGAALSRQYLEAPSHCPDLKHIEADQSSTLDLMSILPWISKYLLTSHNEKNMRLLPLTCGWGAAAVMLLDRPALPRFNELKPLIATWAAAIASARQHDAAPCLDDALAETQNRALAKTHDQLLQHESMAGLG